MNTIRNANSPEVVACAIKGIKKMRTEGKTWRAIGICMGIHHSTALRFARRNHLSEVMGGSPAPKDLVTFYLLDDDEGVLEVSGKMSVASYAADIIAVALELTPWAGRYPPESVAE